MELEEIFYLEYPPIVDYVKIKIAKCVYSFLV